MTDSRQLHGKVAVVTGGSRGLGLVIADTLASHGADVVIASRKGDACREVADQLARAHDVTTLGVGCNVSDWDQCDALVAAAYDAFPTVDILVNDAGMSPVYERLEDVTPDLFAKVVGVNMGGPFRLSSVIGSRMAAGNGGSIINISSVAAIRPTADVVPYAMAKAGLNAMTEGMAQAFGPRVRVNAIQAGPFETDVARNWDPDVVADYTRRNFALRRVGQPDEITGAALFFASDASNYCTGAVLRVDGGRA